MGHNEEQYVIRGGRRLEGEVVIAGAKNAALGILAAAVMTDDKVTIENVPYVSDTRTLLKAIENIVRDSRLMMNISERSVHPIIL